MKLAGKIAIVSGGASGIGYAAAKVMLEAGATVGICDVNGERIEQAVKNLSAIGCVRGFRVDISKKEQV